MSIDLDNTKPVDQNDFSFDGLLSNLQRNILKGHGRDHTANLFVEFDEAKKAAVRAWLHRFADRNVTSAKKQLAENERFKRNGISGGLFSGLYLTAKGYEYFEVPEERRPTDASFLGGMENATLADPPQAEWDPAFRDLRIHVMILLADDDKLVLNIETSRLIEELRPLTTDDEFVSNAIRTEYGNAIRNANGDGLEHNGYVDGISQPLFFKDENEKAAANAKPSTGGTAAWDPFAPLKLVLLPDPTVDPGNPELTSVDACGSYFVFRKLEQDVRGFKEAERALADALDLNGDAKELAGALVVGRFEDGTPVTLSDEDGMIGSGDANNFNYDHDLAATRCPFHAHIRKTNPRGTGGAEDLAGEKTHIMARRGIPFGRREVTPEIESQPEQFPTDGVGLLFMSFQTDLANQFEFIQKNWANLSSFPFSNPSNSGVDPIIGQGGTPADRQYKWFKKYGDASVVVTQGFESFIKMRGGQYFFAPSIDGLKSL